MELRLLVPKRTFAQDELACNAAALNASVAGHLQEERTLANADDGLDSKGDIPKRAPITQHFYEASAFKVRRT